MTAVPLPITNDYTNKLNLHLDDLLNGFGCNSFSKRRIKLIAYSDILARFEQDNIKSATQLVILMLDWLKQDIEDDEIIINNLLKDVANKNIFSASVNKDELLTYIIVKYLFVSLNY